MAPLISTHGKDTPLGWEDLPSLVGDGAVVALVAASVVEHGLGKEFASHVTSCSSAIPRVVDREEGVGGARGGRAVYGYNAAVFGFSGAELGEGDVPVFLVPEGDGIPCSGDKPGTVPCLVRSVLAVCAHVVSGEDLVAAWSAIGRDQVCHPVAEARFRAENCDYF